VYAVMTMVAQTIEAGVTKVFRTRPRRPVPRRTCVELAGWSKPAEVVGHAAGAPLVAPLSGTACLWYVIRVSERYSGWSPAPLGPAREEHTETLAEQASGRLSLSDETGTVLVDPAGAELTLGTPSFQEFEGRAGDGSLTARVARILGTDPPQNRHKKETLGFLVEEWAVTTGSELRVVGRPRTEEGEIVLRTMVIDRAGV
jgi:E3 Ubiquitin ligase